MSFLLPPSVERIQDFVQTHVCCGCQTNTNMWGIESRQFEMPHTTEDLETIIGRGAGRGVTLR